MDFIKHIHTQIINEMEFTLQVYIQYNQRQEQKLKLAEYEKDAKDDINPNNYNPNNTSIEADDELAIWHDIALKSNDLSVNSAKILLDYKYNKNKHELEDEICNAIKCLWKQNIIKEIYNLRNITKIEISSAHFWNKLDNTKDSNYLASTIE